MLVYQEQVGMGLGEFRWGKKFLRESLGKDNWNSGHLEAMRKPGSVELPEQPMRLILWRTPVLEVREPEEAIFCN